MNSRIIVHAAAVATVLCASSAIAQTRAVEATHVQFGLNSIDSDTSDSTSSGALGLDLIATFPLGSYLGLSLGGNYTESKVRSRDVLPDEPGAVPGTRQSCSFDSTEGDLSLFFRRPSFGRLAVSYGTGNLSSDCEGDAVFLLTGKDSLGVDSYRVDAEYYIGDFTIGAGYTTTTLEDSAEDLKTTTLSASWYPIDSLKISLWGNDLYEDNSYGLAVEHQPGMLGDGFSVRLGLSTTDASPKTRTIQLGLAYFFGREVPLKTRDRQYR